MTTHSTEEAMALLKRTRAELIDIARQIAREQIEAHGSTHSRQVLEAMEQLGLLDDTGEISDYWLGAVFRRTEFKWTGEWYHYSDDRVMSRNGKRRNIHERTIKVWQLR